MAQMKLDSQLRESHLKQFLIVRVFFEKTKKQAIWCYTPWLFIQPINKKLVWDGFQPPHNSKLNACENYFCCSERDFTYRWFKFQ